MDSKIISVLGVNICITESNENARNSLLFIHGNSGSGKFWKPQLESTALEDYHVIAVDLPGHGNSARLNNLHQYNCIFFAEIIVDILTKYLQGKPCVIVGYSLGANVAAALPLDQKNIKGFALAGSSVIGKAFTPASVLFNGGSANILLSNQNTQEEIMQFYDLLSHLKNSDYYAQYLEDYYQTDPLFREAFFANTINGQINDGIQQLQAFGIPVLVVFGAEEMIINRNYLETHPFDVWKNKIEMINDAGHQVSADQPATFNKLLKEYSANQFAEH